MHNVDVVLSPVSLAKTLKQMACLMSNATIEHPEAVRTFFSNENSDHRRHVCLFGNDISDDKLVYEMVKVAEDLEQFEEECWKSTDHLRGVQPQE